MTNEHKKSRDEIMKRRALARWENEGGRPGPENTLKPKPDARPVQKPRTVREREKEICD